MAKFARPEDKSFSPLNLKLIEEATEPTLPPPEPSKPPAPHQTKHTRTNFLALLTGVENPQPRALEIIETRSNLRAQGGGIVELGQLADERVRVALSDEVARIGKGSYRLDREQRNPLGTLDDARHIAVVQPGRQAAQQSDHGIRPEGLEVQGNERAVTHPEVGPSLE